MYLYIHSDINTKGCNKLYLGNKGFMLSEMKKLNIDVPDFFVITTNTYKDWKNGKVPETQLFELIRAGIKSILPSDTVSCRSSAPVSMPGILDTFLNLKTVDLEVIKENVIKVFHSWENDLSVEYRKNNSISSDLGIAVIIQNMVDGENSLAFSGTGVISSRNPNTSANEFFGEFLINSRGDMLMSGERTPFDISLLKEFDQKIWAELCKVSIILDKYFGFPQEIEFTIDAGRLYFLQTRNNKIFLDGEGSKEKQTFSVKIGAGIPASSGIITGKIVFDAKNVLPLVEQENEVILVREFTKPDDYFGMIHAHGFLTSIGGKTSHAAVIARSLRKPCIVGANITFEHKDAKIKIGDTNLNEGDVITIDGKTGFIYK